MFDKLRECAPCSPSVAPITPDDVESLKQKLKQLNAQTASGTFVRVAQVMRARKTLELFASDHCPEVRAAVADNPVTSDGVRMTLANDKDSEVRYRVAENPRSPRKALSMLIEDKDPYVARRAKITYSRLAAQSKVALAILPPRAAF